MQLSDRDQRGDVTKGSGKTAANQTMRILRALLNYAQWYYGEDHAVPRANPVKGLKFNIERRRSTHISTDELERWFKAVWSFGEGVWSTHWENDMVFRECFRDYVLLLIFSGLRKEEGAQLKWENVDFNRRCFTIMETKNREEHQLPMTRVIQEIFERRQALAQINNPYVFTGRYANSYLQQLFSEELR